MRRIVLAFLLLALLLAAIVSVIDVRSDAGSVLGAAADGVGSLDTYDGRSFVIALIDEDTTTRNIVARQLTEALANNDLVATAHTGPAPLSTAFLDLLWERRFRLAPPQPDDLTVAQLAERLEAARQELGRGTGMVMGDHLLRDPTGSFATLTRRLGSAAHGLAQADGIWQSHDDTAALVFVTLADQPFDVQATAQLSENIRAQTNRLGVRSEVLGPRIIAAQISVQTTQAASFAALAATVLLIAWLIWILRSVGKLLSAFLPLALGVASATLAVQLAFGSVHVIALGFGGALTGLALDYPLHILAHGTIKQDATKRLILIGAATTAAGFLALLGSGVTALMQTGLFVAIGLVIAAIASRIIVQGADTALRAPAMERLVWRLPFKAWVEAGLLILGVLVVVTTASGPGKALFDQDGDVETVISRFATLLQLPSGQHTIVVEGETLDQLLVREAAIRPILDGAIQDGILERYAMTAQFIAANASAKLATLPAPEEFRRRAVDALTANGMAPAFSTIQTEAYRTALEAPPISAADFEAHPELQALFGRLENTSDGWRENVHLFGLRAPDIVARAINQAQMSGVDVIDVRSGIETGLIDLRQRVGIWLGVGAMLAFSVLLVGLGDWRRAFAIARTTAAATSITAACLTLAGGSVGIFQIVALTLIVGIGIDYGLFLTRSDGMQMNRARCRSVALCAGSTLIAFSVMSLASIRILQEVGLAVSLGVLVMLVLNLAQPWQPGATQENDDIE